MSNPTRRTLSGLTPRTAASTGEVRQLIRSNRESSSTPPLPEPKETNPNSPVVQDSVSPELPKYLKLKRREARVYDEQADELTVLARRINSGRRLANGKTVGERITDNTLLRLAIDLLLTRSDDLKGTTEEELAASLGLKPRRTGAN